jgi:hypothetical protein
MVKDDDKFGEYNNIIIDYKLKKNKKKKLLFGEDDNDLYGGLLQDLVFPKLNNDLILKKNIKNEYFTTTFDDNKINYLIKKNEIKEYNNLEYIIQNNYEFNENINEYNINNLNQNYLDILNDEHNNYINIFGKNLDHDITLTPTEHQEQSAEYAAKIREIQKYITPEEMNAVISMLRVGALITASSGLASVLADKAQQVSPKLRKQTERLIGVYQNTLSTESPVGQVLERDVSRTKSAKLYAPESDDLRELNRMLVAGGACTRTTGEPTNDKLEKRPVKCYAEDSKAGGSVHFLFSGNPNCSAYNRMYLATGEEGKPFAFLDCIESGNMGRSSMQAYLDNGLSEELLGSFASSIIIANRLGLEKLAFGDLEFVDLARGLGFGERKVFNNGDSPYDAKLGYKGGTGHTNGPYLWTMGRTGGSNYRTIDPRQFNPNVLEMIAESTESVIDRLENSKRKAIKNLKSDFEDYFSMVRQIYSDSRNILGECADLALERIDSVANKHGFELNGLRTPAVSEEEFVEPDRIASGF